VSARSDRLSSARKTNPVLDALFRRAPPVVEGDDALSGAHQVVKVFDDVATMRVQLSIRRNLDGHAFATDVLFPLHTQVQLAGRPFLLRLVLLLSCGAQTVQVMCHEK
jgi:hypothetical protein